MSKGDLMTNIWWFLLMIMVAIILALWYAKNIHPTRYAIGTVNNDLEEIGSHISNACPVTFYNATYLFKTKRGVFSVNSTDYCISAERFSLCKRLLCPAEPVELSLENSRLLTITKNGSLVFS